MLQVFTLTRAKMKNNMKKFQFWYIAGMLNTIAVDVANNKLSGAIFAVGSIVAFILTFVCFFIRHDESI